MSLKVLCFGYSKLMSKVINKLKANQNLQTQTQQQIIIDSLNINNKSFITFQITNPQLLNSQASGTSGLMYFLDHTQPIFQQRQILLNAINSGQFQSVPIVLLYNKIQSKMKFIQDRASMIRQIDLDSSNGSTGVQQIFGWIDNQIQFKKTRGSFNAHPKIVKMKAKYRQSQIQTTQGKYQQIIRDKKYKNIGVKNQQQAYITQQKQRIKKQNMQKQLNHYINKKSDNKNVKDDGLKPYDIKATPNPKIQPNLHFFLKDNRVQKVSQANIKIQTDQFKQLPKQKSYVPKKTGINVSTQIQVNQLFDFNYEVSGILDILVTKALQIATLQIEQQQQILKIQKYKNQYKQRKSNQNVHQQQNINSQLKKIQQKQNKLKQAKKRQQIKKQNMRKQLQYSISDTYVKNIYKDAAKSLYNKNYYPNQLIHALKIDYLPEVLNRALISYNKILQNQSSIQNLFDKSCLQPLIQKNKKIISQHQQKKLIKKQKKINKSKNIRYVNIFYQSQQHKFSTFSKYLNSHLQGNFETTYKARQQQLIQAQTQYQSQQIQQTQYLKIKNKDNDQYHIPNQNSLNQINHNQFIIPNQKITFQFAQSLYNRPLNISNLQGGVIGVKGYISQNQKSYRSKVQHSQRSKQQNKSDKQFQQLQLQKLNQSYEFIYNCQKFIKINQSFRDPNQIVNYDKNIQIDLINVPQTIQSLILYFKLKNVDKYIHGQQVKQIKNSAYRLIFSSHQSVLSKFTCGKNKDWINLINQQQQNFDSQNQQQKNQQQQQQQQQQKKKIIQFEKCIYFLSYHIFRYNGQWKIQQLHSSSNIIRQSQQKNKQNIFVKKLQQYFKKTQDQPHQQEQQQQVKPRQQSKNQKRNKNKRKSTQQKLVAKINLDQSQNQNKSLTSKVLKQIKIQTNNQFEKQLQKLNQIINQWKQFSQSSPDGWEFYINNNKLQNIQQLLKYKKVGDLKVQKIIPVLIQQKQQQDQQQQQDKQSQQNN